MNEIKSVPFEFKIPEIPERTQRNVIPTGKQIPRTPINPEKEVKQNKDFNSDTGLSSVPRKKPVCSHEITLRTKNCIPKGKEIPRTPVLRKMVVGSSSSHMLTVPLPDVDLGVQPLNSSDDKEDIDFKVEMCILTGKINVRKKSSKKKNMDENTLHASIEDNQDCRGSTNPSIKLTAPCKTRSAKDSSEHLCEEMETKCALYEKAPLKNISNENTNSYIRRNPERRAKRNVNYKL